MSGYIKRFQIGLLLAVLLSALWSAPATAQSGSTITAYNLIALVNNIRTGNGLPALEVSSILMSTAFQQTQGTAPVAEPVEAPVGTATPPLPPTSQALKSPANLLDRTIGYVLGSIFAVGALPVGFGLLARRENS
ncbi:MAG: hypothetical protein ACYC3P_09330 [Bellilinea sp.]